MTELGRLLDRDGLDADARPRARAKVTVPEGWADGASSVEIVLPRVLVCARCDGGGCDGCGRSGALRGPSEEATRVVRVALPKGLGNGVCVRLVEPFGGGSVIAQLWLEVFPGDAERSVRRIEGVRPPRRRPVPPAVVIAALIAALGGLVWAIVLASGR